MFDEAVFHATTALRQLLASNLQPSDDDQASIQKALVALHAYPASLFTGAIEVSVGRYHVLGSTYACIRVSEDGLQLSSGGSVYDPAVSSDNFSHTEFAHYHRANKTESEYGWEESWQETWRNNLPDSEDSDEDTPTVSVEDNSEPLPDAPDVVAESFAAYTAELPILLARLQTCAPVTRAELSGRVAKETPGIYVFYDEFDNAQYVGRTRDLRRRLGEHGRESSTHFSASFAFLRARKAAEPTHDLRGFSRKELASEHVAFMALFAKEKRTVANMTVRWVVVDRPVTQALLEVYAALELGTPFNSFETS